MIKSLCGVVLLGSLMLVLPAHMQPSAAQAPGAIRPHTPLPAQQRNIVKPGPTLGHMIGQMIMVGFVGTSSKDDGVKTVLDLLSTGKIGGVMLLGRNIKSPRQLKHLSAALLGAARAGHQPITLISVDQEGGRVQRLKAKNGHETFPYSAQTIAKRCTPQQAGKVYRKMACQLRSAGININFGPVVDLDIAGRRNPIIGRLGRSFGTDPDMVVRYASWFNGAHKAYGLLTAAKHFPGHGSSLTDSHREFTNITDTWRKQELKPYASLSKFNFADMVMTGHLYHSRFSNELAPASLSPKAIKHELRQRLGFKGVVITDDLQMKAVRRYTLSKRIPMAVNAGNDIVLLSNTVTPYATLGGVVHDIILRNVRTSCPRTSNASCIERAVIEAAYKRILAMKIKLAQLMRQTRPERCDLMAPVVTTIKNVCTKSRLKGRHTMQSIRQTNLR